jgi:hypothetical protein
MRGWKPCIIIWGLDKDKTEFIRGVYEYGRKMGLYVVDLSQLLPYKQRGTNLLDVLTYYVLNGTKEALCLQTSLEGVKLDGNTLTSYEEFLDLFSRKEGEVVTSIRGSLEMNQSKGKPFRNPFSNRTVFTAKAFSIHDHELLRIFIEKYSRAMNGLIALEDTVASIGIRELYGSNSVLVNKRAVQIKPTSSNEKYASSRKHDLKIIEEGWPNNVDAIKGSLGWAHKTDPIICTWAGRKLARGFEKRQ